jgi:hypothetical protein
MVQSKWNKRDPKIDLIKYVSKKGTVSRIEIVNYMGESVQDVNNTLDELIDTSSLRMEPSRQNSDHDSFSIPSDIQKKSFDELF